MFDEEEQKAFDSVVSHFNNYRSILRLPKIKRSQAKRLKEDVKEYYILLDQVEDRIIRNSFFLKEIVKDYQGDKRECTFTELDKIRTVLKQFARDWSVQGAKEREDCYSPILNEIKHIYGHLGLESRKEVHILVPGSGLARLARDIASLGFSVQGNEFSFYMLLCSNFILNQ